MDTFKKALHKLAPSKDKPLNPNPRSYHQNPYAPPPDDFKYSFTPPKLNPYASTSNPFDTPNPLVAPNALPHPAPTAVAKKPFQRPVRHPREAEELDDPVDLLAEARRTAGRDPVTGRKIWRGAGSGDRNGSREGGGGGDKERTREEIKLYEEYVQEMKNRREKKWMTIREFYAPAERVQAEYYTPGVEE